MEENAAHSRAASSRGSKEHCLPRALAACVRHPALLWVLVDVFVETMVAAQTLCQGSDFWSGLRFLVTANSHVAPEQNPLSYRCCRSLSSPLNPSRRGWVVPPAPSWGTRRSFTRCLATVEAKKDTIACSGASLGSPLEPGSFLEAAQEHAAPAIGPTLN